MACLDLSAVAGRFGVCRRKSSAPVAQATDVSTNADSIIANAAFERGANTLLPPKFRAAVLNLAQ
jgi:hypothetical protein